MVAIYLYETSVVANHKIKFTEKHCIIVLKATVILLD